MTATISSAEQYRIIKASPKIPLTVITATAGAGKTQTLILRASELVSQHRLKPQQILFVTFTQAAKAELVSRLKRRKLTHIQVKTLHGLAISALRKAGQQVFLMSETQTALLADEVARSVLPERYSFNPEGTGEYVQRRISYMSQQGEPPKIEEDRLIWSKFTEVFDALQTREGDSLTTHDQVLTRFLNLLRSPDSVATTLGVVQQIFVDEAQDLSPLQYKIVRLLGAGRQLTLVGDPLQAIFGFQGASPDLLEAAQAEADEVYTLSVNHRCPASHVELAQQLFPDDQKVEAEKPYVQVNVEFVSRGEPLLRSLIDAVKQMKLEINEFEFKLEDKVAVLVRTRNEMDIATKALMQAGMTVQAVSRKGVDLDPFVRDWLLPCLDSLTMTRTQAQHPLLYLKGGLQLPGTEREIVNAAWLAKIQPEEVRLHLESKFGKLLVDVWSFLISEAITDSSELAAALRLLAYNYDVDLNRNSAEYLCQTTQDLHELRLSLTEHPSDTAQAEGSVMVSTIHSAKGREWPGVILTELTPTAFQSNNAEERRLRYVALTRSTQFLRAILPLDCHPAYRAALMSKEIAAVNRIAHLLGTPSNLWTEADQMLLNERIQQFPHLEKQLKKLKMNTYEVAAQTKVVTRVPIRWQE